MEAKKQDKDRRRNVHEGYGIRSMPTTFSLPY